MMDLREALSTVSSINTAYAGTSMSQKKSSPSFWAYVSAKRKTFLLKKNIKLLEQGIIFWPDILDDV